MSPWNYPFQLSIAPLIGAIAGGNCAVVKPSAYSSHTSSIIKKIIEECFESKFVSVIEGGREANSELLSKKFDYIFFTGSVGVGKIVMEAASKHLTPATLSWVEKPMVHRDTNIDVSARRIIGKNHKQRSNLCCSDYCLP